MKKRLFLLVMVALLMLPCIPVLEASATASPDLDYRAQIQKAMTDVVTKHAAKVLRSDCNKGALNEMAMHSGFGRGKVLYLSEGSDVLSAMFNAKMFQESVIQGATNAIILAQDLQLRQLYSAGNTSWHDYGDTYGYTGYRGTKKSEKGFIGQHTSVQALRGTQYYNGPKNTCDTTMYLIAGGLWCYFQLDEVEVRENTTVYSLKWIFKDRFDFNSTYDAQSKKGLDTSTDELLVKLGRMLNRLGAKDFDWQYTWNISLEVPNACDHTTGNYRWVYNAEKEMLEPIPGDGFSSNPVSVDTRISSQNKQLRYYKLGKAITLKHDKPWVLEYDLSDGTSFSLGPVISTCYNAPGITQSGRSYTWINDTTCDRLADSEKNIKAIYTNNYTGVKIAGLFKYVSKHTYTYRLENRVSGGSNMIWLSIYDKTTGEQVLAPTPMDQHQKRSTGEEQNTIVSENSTRLSGVDLILNRVGSSNGIQNKTLELRVWENGKDTAASSAMTSSYQTPTCTTAGGTTSKCTRCGYTYTKTEAAKGHSFINWTPNHDATCEADGTMSASCTVCGTVEVRTDPGTAKGHTPKTLPALAPSCTQSGLTQGSQCTVCQKILTPQESVNAAGHSWAAATCYVPKTCTACAATEGDVVHQPVPLHAVSPSCTETGLTEGSQCTLCQLVLLAQQTIPANGHNYQDATCETAKTCKTCATTEGDPLGHSEQILAAVAPSCTDTGLTEGKRCTRCEKTLLAQQVLEALGHSWLDATCTDPKTCAACAVTEGEAMGHKDMALFPQEPTCTQTGLTEGSYCETCGEILVAQKTVDALGHVWVEATCTAPKTCQTCGETEGEMLPHNQRIDGAFDPTCTEMGSTGTAVCADCAHVLAEAKVIPAIGHKDADNNKECDLCAISLRKPLSITTIAVIAVGGVAIFATPTALLIRKRKK